MPFYEYYCSSCKAPFKTFHGADEKQEGCPNCNNKEITKLLASLTITKQKSKEETSGKRVEKFIEQSRETLKEQLDEARKEYKS